MRLLWYYLLAAGLVALGMCALDKRRARRGGRRVPEKTLLLMAVAGGGVGLWLGMYMFRHKTRHKRFTVGVPLIIALQIAALVWLRRAAGKW